MGEKWIERNDDFLRELEKISQKVLETGQIDYDSKEFKESFFRQSSHSPYNVKSMNYIEYGVVRKKYLNNRRIFGLKIKEKNVLLSDIISFLGNDEVYQMIANKYSELNLNEIEAAFRVMTIIMLGLGCDEMGLGDE